MAIDALVAAAPELLGAGAADAAAVAAPEVAGAIALPEIAVTAAAPEVAAGAGAAAAGGGGDILAGLGLGSALGIGSAMAGGLSPSTRVAGDFAALPGGGAGPALPIGAVPGFGPGGAPTPAPRPAGAPTSPGVGSVASTGADLSGSTPSGPDPGYYDVATANPDLSAPGGLAPAATPAAAAKGASSLFGLNPGLLGILGAGLGGQLVAPSIMKALGLNKIPQQGQLEGIAGQAQGIAGQQNAYGQQLEQPLATGVLPAPQQAQVDQGLNNAIATIKGKYASLGLSGSSMEADAIGNAQQNAQVVKANIEAQMAQVGVQAVQSALSGLNLADSVYAQIMDAQVSQDQVLQQSIGQFAAAVGGGTALGNALNRKA